MNIRAIALNPRSYKIFPSFPAIIFLLGAVLTCLGLFGFLADGTRVIIISISILLLPGWIVLRLMNKQDEYCLAEKIAIWPCVSAPITIPFSLFAYFTHLPIWLCFTLYFAILAWGIAIILRRDLKSELPKDNQAPASFKELIRFLFLSRINNKGAIGFTALVLIIIMVVFFSSSILDFTPNYIGDTKFHLAQINRIGYSGDINPDCSYFKGLGPDTRYPYPISHFQMGLIARGSSLTPWDFWAFLPVAFTIFALSAFFMTTRRLFNLDGLDLASLLAFASLIASGVIVYGWSHPYPNQLVPVVLFTIMIGVLAKFLRSGTWSDAWLAGFVCAYVSAFHPVSFPEKLILILVTGLLSLTVMDKENRYLSSHIKLYLTSFICMLPVIIIMLQVRADTPVGKRDVVFDKGGFENMVNPEYLLQNKYLMLLLLGMVMAPFIKRSAGALVVLAAAIMVPLFSANPFVVPLITKIIPFRLLYRFYNDNWFATMLPFIILIVIIPFILTKIFDVSGKYVSGKWSPFIGAVALVLWTLFLFNPWNTAKSGIFNILKANQIFILAMSLHLIIVGLFLNRIGMIHVIPSWLKFKNRGSAWLLIFMVAIPLLKLSTNDWKSTLALQKELSSQKWHNRGTVNAKFKDWKLQDEEDKDIPGFFRFIGSYAPQSKVVAYNNYEVIEWVPALTNQYVLAMPGNTNPRLRDLEERQKALDDIYDPRLGLRKTVELVKKYDVDLILKRNLPERSDEYFTFPGTVNIKLEKWPELFTKVYSDDYMAVFEYTSHPDLEKTLEIVDDAAGHDYIEASQPVVNYSNKLALTRAYIEPKDYYPGDKILVHLRWKCLSEMKNEYRFGTYILRMTDRKRFYMDHFPCDRRIKTSDLKVGDEFDEVLELECKKEIKSSDLKIVCSVYYRTRDGKVVNLDKIENE